MDDFKAFMAYLRQIEGFTDQQLSETIRFAETLLKERESIKNYDPTKDPIVQGETLISSSTDLAERMEDLLYGEQTPLSASETQSS
ncbi:MAG: hypothetical protein H7Y09_00590 [Chitinophagaceae bacterium]|nr:hypothetical protein [Anaerolineae bacterium]